MNSGSLPIICSRGVILTLLFLFLSAPAWPKKQALVFNEEETLVVKVNLNGPVRISVKGDRLQDVMGLDESVSVEKDETHGLLYLRNLDKKQSITVITEGGTVQDMTLIPEAGGVSAVVLKSKDFAKDFAEDSLAQHSTRVSYPAARLPIRPQTTLANSSFQEQVLMLIRQLYQGGGGLGELNTVSERTVAYGIVAKPLRCLQLPDMRGEVYAVVNTTETTLNLVEKDFYQVGDYALSIGKKQLESGEQTLLVVVRHV
jgi:hypothetical protein